MNAESAVRSAKGSYPRALEARGVSFDVARSPVLLSSSHARTTQKAPGGSRGTWFTRTCGVVPQFAWRAFARWFQPGLPGLALTQKAPGGSRGTWFTRTCGVVPQFAWRAFARWFQPGLPGLALTQKAPGGSRGAWFTRTCGVVPQFAWRAFARWFQPGLPGLALTQKAPGGSRGTPGGMPSRLPCEAGSNREIVCRHPAWTAGWFSCPESPGFHPGLLGRATRTIPNS